MRYCVFLFFCIAGIKAFYGQDHYVTTIAFYNLENLFDCTDDPNIFDEEYLPTSKKNWTKKRLQDKLQRISNTLIQVGAVVSKKPPVIIGVAEVENRNVLEDLISTKAFATYDYGIVHKDSPDKRGIDVAMLYNRNIFKIKSTQKHFLKLLDEKLRPIYTRDQLCVSGFLAGELIHVIVNHWPSRRGGVFKSEPKRIAAAKLSLQITDSLKNIYSAPKIIMMGDFNDNPKDKSFKQIIKSTGKMSSTKKFFMYNPMEGLFKKGIGSLAYRDRWNLFDQILVSNTLLDTTNWHFKKAGVFNASYLKTTSGKYKGYPKRSFNLDSYNNGYSDHFPVYIFLLKKVFK